ncbi:cation:proton antiporter [Streptomyces chartreusis]|uniref:cation:proton antiporter n=1 Tax=Streptomyces chartreusis TaxID=1969 RepID=UPI0033A9F620
MAAEATSSSSGSVLVSLAVILAAAHLFARLAQRIRQPAVVGEIVAGLALGPSLLGLLPGNLNRLLFPAEVLPHLNVLAELGLVLFMFSIGYQMDISHLRGVGRRLTAISLSSVALPFALGMALAVLIFPWFTTAEMKSNGMLAPALFLGAAMAITAFPVLARIITEHNMHKDRIGTVSLACAAIQDVLAWCILAIIIAIVNSSGAWPLALMVLESLAFVLGLFYVVRPGLRWLLAPDRRWAGASATQAALIVGLLLSAWCTHSIGLHAVFGAFLFGAAVPRRHVDAFTPEVPERIEQSSTFLLPAFFTVTGLSVDLGGLGVHGVIMVIAVVTVACVGKMVGAAGAARLTGAGNREAVTLGILLNTRGLTELVILNVGLSLGVIDSRTFTAMTLMAVITTVMTGPLLRRVRPKSQDIPQTRAGDHDTGGTRNTAPRIR